MKGEWTISEQLVDEAVPPDIRAEHVADEATEDGLRRVVTKRNDWLPHVQTQLRAIKNLPEGWDSHGSGSPDASVVDTAEWVLRCLGIARDLPRPHVNPTPGGGVQFEWEADDRYFELEVLAERAATYLYCDDSAGVEESGEVFERESLDAIVEYICRVAVVQ